MSRSNQYSEVRIKLQGGVWGRALLYYFLKIFGRIGIKLINFPIVTYYLIVKVKIRRNMFRYWESIRPNQSTIWYIKQIYLNYGIFGTTIIDRLLNDFKIHNEKADKAILDHNRDRGTIILCSHFGGYSFFRYNFGHKKVHVLMLQGETSKEKNEEESYSLTDESSENKAEFISPDDPNAIFKAAEVLNNNGILAIMGDRVLNFNDKYNIEVDFLGMKRSFPLGPYYLARATNSVILTLFIIKKGKDYYLEFNDEIEVDRNKKKHQAVEEAFYRYLEDFRNVVNQYPHQWFNFTG